VAEVGKRYGRLDVLVSNAGIGIAGASITDMTLADWQRPERHQSRRGVPLGQAQPAADAQNRWRLHHHDVVAGGLRGAPGLSAYSATKGGVRLFAKSIAMECAAAGDGIRVNSVHPGIIDTPIWGKLPTGAAGHGQNAPIDPESAQGW